MPLFSQLATWISLQILYLYTILLWNWYSWQARFQLSGTWGATRSFVGPMIESTILSAIFSLYCHVFCWLWLSMRNSHLRRYFLHFKHHSNLFFISLVEFCARKYPFLFKFNFLICFTIWIRWCGHFLYTWKLLPYFLSLYCYRGPKILTIWLGNMCFFLGMFKSVLVDILCLDYEKHQCWLSNSSIDGFSFSCELLIPATHDSN